MQPGDFIQPEGLLESNLFADTVIRVAAWLTIAEDLVEDVPEASQADAIAAYVYYRAYKAKADILAAKKSQAKIGDDSYSYRADQIRYYGDLASDYKAQFDAFIADVAGEIAPPRRVSVTVHKRTYF